MTKHYEEGFKAKAVSYLTVLKKEGCVRIKVDGEFVDVDTVRQLCLSLEISSYSLYQWVKDFGITVDGKKAKQKPKPKQWKYDDETEAMYDAKREALDPNLEREVFGIRFWGFVAKNLNIPSYYVLPLAQLKYQISLKLKEQSGLVKTIGDS